MIASNQSILKTFRRQSRGGKAAGEGRSEAPWENVYRKIRNREEGGGKSTESSRGSGTIKPSIFTLNTVCLRERKESKHSGREKSEREAAGAGGGGGRKGGADGRERREGRTHRKGGDIYYDFNWTLCLFSDCCSRLPSLLLLDGHGNTKGRHFAHPRRGSAPSATRDSWHVG